MEVGHWACPRTVQMAETRRIYDLSSLTRDDLMRTLTGDHSTPLLWAPSGMRRQEPPLCPDFICSQQPPLGPDFICSQQGHTELPEVTAQTENIHKESSSSRSEHADRSRSSTPAAAIGYQRGHAETRLLLSLYRSHIPEFTDKKTKKTRVWKKIAEELSVKGYHVTDVHCSNRWKTLKSLFPRTVDHNKQTGCVYSSNI